MAETPPYFLSNSASNACKCIRKVNGGASNETNSKPSFMDLSLDLQDGSSLSLGLGCSMSSGVTMFSGKEFEDDSSANLDLTMNLHNQTVNPDCGGAGAGPSTTQGPKVDLELTLVSASVESDVSAVSRASFPFKYNVKPLVTSSTMTSAGFQLVDEGSTSSRWKLPLLTPLHATEPASLFHDVHAYNGPNFVIHGPSASFDPGLVHLQQRRSGNVKDCRYPGCRRGARGASGFCIAHGGGRRCQREGCQKGAEGKTVFCKSHGGGRRCEFLGCTKSAEGRTDYCIGHGGGKRCSHDGCTHAARGKSGLCIRHGGGKRCKMEGCTKSAEGVSGLCISHGGGRRCHHPACTKGAQGSTLFCKAHGGGKRCTFLGCTKGAEGSTNLCKGHGGGKRCTFEGGCSKSVHGGTLFCVNHGGGKRCAVPECTKSARGRTSFCVRHGGGKRCKHEEGCGKSAQGRTDFCKAHGGGKRCSWGQVEESGVEKSAPCDKFARGKSGLCASHSQLVQENQTPAYQGGSMSMGLGLGLAGYQNQPRRAVEMGSYSLPEGRVHGGGLMAMLRGCASTSGPAEPVESAGGRWL